MKVRGLLNRDSSPVQPEGKYNWKKGTGLRGDRTSEKAELSA